MMGIEPIKNNIVIRISVIGSIFVCDDIAPIEYGIIIHAILLYPLWALSNDIVSVAPVVNFIISYVHRCLCIASGFTSVTKYMNCVSYSGVTIWIMSPLLN